MTALRQGKSADFGGRRLRLGALPAADVERIRRDIGQVRSAPWPRIEGCLAMVFIARSGSTFLARELEHAYAIGRMEESLNPKIVDDRPVAEIVRDRQAPWFAFKANMIGVIAGELYGFTDAYLHKMVFLRLVRRDIVAQAVSTAKAVQTQQWHLFDKPAGRAAYDGEQIAAAVRRIARGVDDLRQYVHLTDRPSRLLIYEDFSGDDFTPALQACELLGRASPPDARSRRLSPGRAHGRRNQSRVAGPFQRGNGRGDKG